MSLAALPHACLAVPSALTAVLAATAAGFLAAAQLLRFRKISVTQTGRSSDDCSDDAGDFLLHLAEEGIISSPQLSRAEEALRQWRRRGIRRKLEEAARQQQQPPEAQEQDKLAVHTDHADTQEEERQLQQPHSQSYPGLHVPAEDLFELLPDHLLDHAMPLLTAVPGCAGLRATCQRLRSAFDRFNPRLVLRDPRLPHACLPLLRLQLLLGGPCIRSLTLEGDSGSQVWELLLPRGGGPLQRLERLSLRGCSEVEDLDPLAGCSGLRQLEAVHCSRLMRLSQLQCCTQLQRLELLACVELESLAPLAACTQLQHLSLRGCSKVEDLDPLASCVGLRHLDLRGCEVRSIDPLEWCVELQHLDLGGCEVRDLRALGRCTALQHLVLTSSAVSTLGRLAALAVAGARLQHLELEDCPSLRNEALAPLAACTALRFLTLARCYDIEDLRPLASCTHLLHLDASNTGLQDLGPLAACSRLRYLALHGCKNLQALGPLTACSALGFLELKDCCRVTALGPLATLRELQCLDVRGCSAVKDMRPLDALTGCHILRD